MQKGLDQLALLPVTPERQRQELEFRSALGAVLMLVKGYAAPETGHAYARARELWEQLGSPSEFLHVPYGQFFYHVNRCEFDLAQSLAADLLRLSLQHNDTAGTRTRSHLLRTSADAYRQVCVIPIASRRCAGGL